LQLAGESIGRPNALITDGGHVLGNQPIAAASIHRRMQSYGESRVSSLAAKENHGDLVELQRG
jgi:hypothetical protein